MAKVDYTPLFEEFWKAYPRRVAKGPAFKAWQKQVDEQDAFMPRAVIDDVKKRTRLNYWPYDKTKVPHAATWLNARRWEDEGWEEEIKTRGQEHQPSKPVSVYRQERIEDAYDCDGWQMMLNRVLLSYLRLAGGFDDETLQLLVAAKNAVHAEQKEYVNEEIDTREDKREARREMAIMMVKSALARFDKISGRELSHQILASPRRRAA